MIFNNLKEKVKDISKKTIQPTSAEVRDSSREYDLFLCEIHGSIIVVDTVETLWKVNGLQGPRTWYTAS